MSVYYPQAVVSLEMIWEDWGQPGIIETRSNILVLTPKNLEVQINNYKEADTARITLDYKTFPFEPRVIRTIKVTAYMANMEGLLDEKLQPIRLFPLNPKDTSDASIKKYQEQLKDRVVFVGFADESTIQFNRDTREVVIECRDQTSLLIDTKHSKSILDLNLGLTALIQKILRTYKSTEPLADRIEFRPPELETSVPNLAAASTDIGDAKKNSRKSESSWDVIVDLCNRVALVPFIELDKLIITRPKVIYNYSDKILFVWGKNITNMRIKRKIGRNKGLNIIVRSLVVDNISAKGEHVIQVKYPFDKTGKAQTVKKIVDGKVEEEEAPYHVFFLPQIGDRQKLLERAEDIWEEMARQEIEGTISTKCMVLCQGTKNNAESQNIKQISAMDIKMGSPIDVKIDTKDLEALSQVRGKGIGAMRDKLIELCYPPQVANALANTYELMRKIATPLYTKKVTFKISASQGFAMDIDYINFIELDEALAGTDLKKAES